MENVFYVGFVATMLAVHLISDDNGQGEAMTSLNDADQVVVKVETYSQFDIHKLSPLLNDGSTESCTGTQFCQ